LRVEEYEDAFRKLSSLESAVDAERNDLALKIKGSRFRLGVEPISSCDARPDATNRRRSG